ncbi:MAG: 50S ribosomal protein L32 [Candidatus Moranbacteria bacterium RIFCSPHIGHO2_02_FULL_40_12b]|nr:MAG: 50S ribosomal protein L32 [Candidatus Moranbacteria bacterium RIFCSPHIGHO2_02_FULL_40_12b]OGI24323.1 MAG: 50S ribosomal protein L32 [Candidatus Moranbacteria bacterium RIFCSPHIGHO2_12_FULL_40_10]
MSVPKQRHTKFRRDRKRKRFAIKAKKTQTCPKCDRPMMPHRACSSCGYYKGREIVNTMKKVKKTRK